MSSEIEEIDKESQSDADIKAFYKALTAIETVYSIEAQDYKLGLPHVLIGVSPSFKHSDADYKELFLLLNNQNLFNWTVESKLN